MEHGINHILVFDYQLYLRQLFSLACSDLETCYDIIVHSYARLAFQRIWIPLPSIISMLDTIQSMSHTVRTAYGDSNITYGVDTITDDFKNFVMGLCQVNGCAIQIFPIISSIVFSALQTQVFVIHLVNSFTTEIAQLVEFRYLYDCDMIQSDDDIEAPHS